MQGWALRSCTEVAGLAPGAGSLRFAKQQVDAQYLLPLASFLNLSFTASAGRKDLWVVVAMRLVAWTHRQCCVPGSADSDEELYLCIEYVPTQCCNHLAFKIGLSMSIQTNLFFVHIIKIPFFFSTVLNEWPLKRDLSDFCWAQAIQPTPEPAI